MSRSVFLAFILSSTFFAISAAEAAQKTIELSTLVKMYMIPATARYSAGNDWSAGNNRVSPIEWHKPSSPNSSDASRRKFGEAIVTVDGHITHNTEQWNKPEVGKWRIELMGSPTNVFTVSIESDLMDHELNGLDIKSTLEKSNINITTVKCFGEPATGGHRLHKISTINKKPAWLLERWSCGETYGCWRGFEIYYRDEDAKNVSCLYD